MRPISSFRYHLQHCIAVTAALWLVGSIGCGTTREYNATQQLVMSDAVDRSVSSMDFRPLTGRKVYLDTSYMRQVKSESFVNAEYVTSALRQQIVGAGCLIQDASSDADIIIEARIGTLGADDHRVTFGVPENNSLATAAALIPGAPAISTIPEIAFARREAREAAAKVAAFAYDRETRAPIWQSGVNASRATAKDTWVMGVGPFQAGTIRKKTKLAGSSIRFGGEHGPDHAPYNNRPRVDYTAETKFQKGWPLIGRDGLAAYELGLSKVGELPEESTVPQTATKTTDTDADDPTIQF